MEQGILRLFGGGKEASDERARRRKVRAIQDSQGALDERIELLDRQVNELEAKILAVKRLLQAELRAHGTKSVRARRLMMQKKNFEKSHDLKTKMLIECEQQRSHLDTMTLTQDYVTHMRDMRDAQQVALGDPDEFEDLANDIEEYQDDQEELTATMQEHTEMMARVLGGGDLSSGLDAELEAEFEAMQLEELKNDMADLPAVPRERPASTSPSLAARTAPSPPRTPEPAYDALLDAM